MKKGVPIGVIRFDKCDNEEYSYEVSINISLEVGKRIWEEIITNGIRRFLKEVKIANLLEQKSKTK